jgi:hypothetical protein
MPTGNLIDLSRADVVFISYDEPEADANFADLREKLPRARRVHGVKGFDAAHRRAAEGASDWVFTIDGDNRITDPAFFDGFLDVAPRDLGQVFSFSARNGLNGLSYGNGGVKLWPRVLLQELRSHEGAARREAQLDFWTVPFFLIHRELSEVRMAATPAQAFRSGYREGVKLCVIRAQAPAEAFPDLSLPEAFARHLGSTNLDRLRVWCSIGADQPNGDWAIFGARLGAVRTALEGAPPQIIADYADFARFWEGIASEAADPSHRLAWSEALAARLSEAIGLALPNLDAEASARARAMVRPLRGRGPMVPL